MTFTIYDGNVNSYGIKGRWYETSHYGHHDKDGKWHNAQTFVPYVCLSCWNLEIETGDYGEKLTPPYCLANVPRFPTRKGTCKKQDIVNSLRQLKKRYSEGAD